MINYLEPHVNWVHLAQMLNGHGTPYSCKQLLNGRMQFAPTKGIFYELMNLMNFKSGFTACHLFCINFRLILVTKHNVEPGFWACKFIKFIRLLYCNFYITIITYLLLKTVKNDEYMNRYEQTWGLFPFFVMWLVNR